MVRTGRLGTGFQSETVLPESRLLDPSVALARSQDVLKKAAFELFFKGGNHSPEGEACARQCFQKWVIMPVGY